MTRLLLYGYLLIQAAFAFYVTGWSVLFAALEARSTVEDSSTPAWALVICGGLAFISSCIIFKGLFKRTAWTNRRGRVLAAICAIIAVCILDVIRNPNGYTLSDFYPVNNPPLTINICILIILTTKPLSRYIFALRK